VAGGAQPPPPACCCLARRPELEAAAARLGAEWGGGALLRPARRRPPRPLPTRQGLGRPPPAPAQAVNERQAPPGAGCKRRGDAGLSGGALPAEMYGKESSAPRLGPRRGRLRKLPGRGSLSPCVAQAKGDSTASVPGWAVSVALCARVCAERTKMPWVRGLRSPEVLRPRSWLALGAVGGGPSGGGGSGGHELLARHWGKRGPEPTGSVGGGGRVTAFAELTKAACAWEFDAGSRSRVEGRRSLRAFCRARRMGEAAPAVWGASQRWKPHLAARDGLGLCCRLPAGGIQAPQLPDWPSAGMKGVRY
jgi:hypothetical protein